MKNIIEFAKKINKNNGARAYLVGGAVRDLIMGLPSKDFDLELFGITTDILERFLIGEYEFKLNSDAKFPVYRVLIGGEWVEIGFPRKENKTGIKHSDYTVLIDPFMSVADAAMRRDFTMNAIYYDLISGEFIDPHGGVADIAKKQLVPVNNITFREDALRIWRAFQFIARFGFDASQTEAAINDEMRAELQHISPSSVYGEIRKAIIHGKYFGLAIEYLYELLPVLQEMNNTPQNPKYHREGSVFIHTKMVVTEIMKSATPENAELLFFSALLHDIAKPKTFAIGKAGQPTFYNHEKEADDLIDIFASKHSLPIKLTKQIKAMVQNHMITSQYKNKKLHKIAEELAAVGLCFDDLMLLVDADSRSAIKDDVDLQTATMLDVARLRAKINTLNIQKKPIDPLVNGNTIIGLSNHTIKGKQLGMLLAEVKALQFAGRLNTQSEAVEFLQKRINNLKK